MRDVVVFRAAETLPVSRYPSFYEYAEMQGLSPATFDPEKTTITNILKHTIPVRYLREMKNGHLTEISFVIDNEMITRWFDTLERENKDHWRNFQAIKAMSFTKRLRFLFTRKL